ncbi:RNA polymerase sigma factor [Solirubrobacter ginsenosidimutans]|uniref:RNA polymerase sigma factor n=1 Tax=Solirubrobacter ginsenosidimutans TaxID=490573 RepID=A0A9X3MX61_9ACTN|nr:RNA polymerase sigma factor [Solirubrobacter ginsenosidimutans]MDA0162993.1 RNA polymerase sigma factor [Solirubrobacter ginsenosidimutans]
MELLDDRDLLVLARTDAAAFAVFYRRHAHGVLAYFRRRVFDTEAAFDLTAETFAVALRSVPRFEPKPTPAASWLYGIAHNLLRDAIRRGAVEDRARRALAMEPIVLDDEAIELLEAETPALDALEALPADQREAITAHHLDDDGYDAIAGRLGCSESVVRQRVSRGLRTLRSQMTPKDCADGRSSA